MRTCPRRHILSGQISTRVNRFDPKQTSLKLYFDARVLCGVNRLTELSDAHIPINVQNPHHPGKRIQRRVSFGERMDAPDIFHFFQLVGGVQTG
jgi:hypothetical protein